MYIRTYIIYKVHHAAFYGHAELVERLIDFGAEVDARDHFLWTPLHHAALKVNFV